MKKVFIDGSAGTTGLNIWNRLAERQDLELLVLPENDRKDPALRREMINEADISFLCLPDAAALEAAEWLTDPDSRLIDTSTAHRCNPEWCYGFAELHGQRERIRKARLVANPGCHASGFIALIRPLTESGILPKDALVSCCSLTGYSGGGKKMIAEYEAEGRSELLDAPRAYGLSQQHKHLPEMQMMTGLRKAPIFIPVVAPYYQGMEVTVPLFRDHLKGSPEQIRECYRDYYRDGLVYYTDEDDEGGFLAANKRSGMDDMEITVHGNAERITVTARFDNLGKGACGAAIQNMNLMLGLEETIGLKTGGRG